MRRNRVLKVCCVQSWLSPAVFVILMFEHLKYAIPTCMLCVTSVCCQTVLWLLFLSCVLKGMTLAAVSDKCNCLPTPPSVPFGALLGLVRFGRYCASPLLSGWPGCAAIGMSGGGPLYACCSTLASRFWLGWCGSCVWFSFILRLKCTVKQCSSMAPIGLFRVVCSGPRTTRCSWSLPEIS